MLGHVTTRWLLPSLLLMAAAMAAAVGASCGDGSGDDSGTLQPSGASVPMFRGDPAHTGVQPGPGVERSPTVLWRFDAGINAGLASPVVANGVVYSCGAGNLYALDAGTGEEIWRREERCFSSLAVVDGVVYSGWWDWEDLHRQGFRALAAEDGEELWSVLEEFAFAAPPTVVDGVVYVTGGPPEPNSRVNYLFALDVENGKELWRLEIGGGLGGSSPAVVDGIVYVGTPNNGYMYAVNADSGEELWRSKHGRTIFSSPAVVGGVAYFGVIPEWLIALDAESGEELWRAEFAEDVISSPAVAEGVVYIGDERLVRALDADTGEDLWRVEVSAGGLVDSSPAVVDGVVYVASDSGHSGFVYALDAATGQELWHLGIDGSTYSSPAVVDGVVYIGSGVRGESEEEYGYIYAITEG
jgi:outer membrane protein assembly factor BamB